MSNMAVLKPNTRHVDSGSTAGAGGCPTPERRSTERRSNVIPLQCWEERLRYAARAAGFGIYDFDCASGAVRWSPELKAIAYLPPDYVPTSLEQVVELAHPEDRERLLGKLRGSLEPQGGGEFEDDFRLCRPGGSLRWVKLKGWTSFAGEGGRRRPCVAMGLIVDRAVEQAARAYGRAQARPSGRPGELPLETDAAWVLHELHVHQVELEMQNVELRQAQEMAAAALRRYTELYDHAPVGYFSLGRDGNIAQLNLAGAALLGAGRERLVGTRFGVYVEESDRAAFNAFVARVLAGPPAAAGEGDSCEIVLINPDQPQLRRIAHIRARRAESGGAIDAVASDITEKMRATDELIRSNLELQQFAYVAAHDLQTPLRSISGFAQLLQQEYGAQHGEQADSWVHQVLTHVQRMRSLINDLLAYSRLDSPSRPAEPTDFNRLFDDVLGAMEASIAENGASVTREQLPTVSVNRIQLAQVLQNLIDNGIKYRGAEPPRIHVSARRESGMWVFSVRDNGIGIDARHQPQVFEIFRRLHSQQEYPGTGIGLSICQRVIHRHGGHIWLESSAGRGSTFHFSLPDRQPG